jgi:hypothetical protein
MIDPNQTTPQFSLGSRSRSHPPRSIPPTHLHSLTRHCVGLRQPRAPLRFPFWSLSGTSWTLFCSCNLPEECISFTFLSLSLLVLTVPSSDFNLAIVMTALTSAATHTQIYFHNHNFSSFNVTIQALQLSYLDHNDASFRPLC